jgi:hypothetical protein
MSERITHQINAHIQLHADSEQQLAQMQDDLRRQQEEYSRRQEELRKIAVPPPIPPDGWEGPYEPIARYGDSGEVLEYINPARNVATFVQWLKLEILALNQVKKFQGEKDTRPGRSINNAHALMRHLGLLDRPDKPAEHETLSISKVIDHLDTLLKHYQTAGKQIAEAAEVPGTVDSEPPPAVQAVTQPPGERLEEVDAAQENASESPKVVAESGSLKLKLKEPPPDAFKAYRAHKATGMIQTELAQLLARELKRPVTQGQVSRWLSGVREWLEGGNVLPPLEEIKSISAIDPNKIDMGARQDGRTKRQREKADE